MTDRRRSSTGSIGCRAPTAASAPATAAPSTRLADPVEMWEWLLGHPTAMPLGSDRVTAARPSAELETARREQSRRGRRRRRARPCAAGRRALPAWEPGAHVDVVLGRAWSGSTRCAATRPTAPPGGSRCCASRPGAAARGYVHDELAAGDVRVRGPRNHFPLLPAARYLFIAGGIGITPILPMLARAEAGGGHWRLLYGGAHASSMAFIDELRALRRPGRHRARRTRPVCSTSPRCSPLRRPAPGSTAAARSRCWPPSRSAARLAAGALHVERFRPAPRAHRSSRTAFEVVLAQSGRRSPCLPAARSWMPWRRPGPVLSSCQRGHLRHLRDRRPRRRARPPRLAAHRARSGRPATHDDLRLPLCRTGSSSISEGALGGRALGHRPRARRARGVHAGAAAALAVRPLALRGPATYDHAPAGRRARGLGRTGARRSTAATGSVCACGRSRRWRRAA